MRFGSALALGLLVSASAQAATFAKIADATSVGPGWSSNVTFGAPAVDAGQVAFLANDVGLQGIYTGSGGALSTVVDQSTLVPDTAETFAWLVDPSISQGTVAFAGSDTNFFFQGIYSASGGGVSRIADSTTPDPDGSGTLFEPLANADIDGANVTFFAQDDTGFGGHYTSVAGVIETSADETIGALNGGALILLSGNPALDGTQVAFLGGSSLGFERAIWVAEANVGRVVADLDTPGPDGETFLGFEPGVDIDGGNVVFLADVGLGSERRIYAEIAGVLVPISDDHSGDVVAIDGDVIAFVGNESGGPTGLYAVHDGMVERLIGAGDALDGKVVSSIGFGANGLSGDQLAFSASFTDSSFGVYLVTIPEPATGMLLAAGLALLSARRRV